MHFWKRSFIVGSLVFSNISIAADRPNLNRRSFLLCSVAAAATKLANPSMVILEATSPVRVMAAWTPIGDFGQDGWNDFFQTPPELMELFEQIANQSIAGNSHSQSEVPGAQMPIVKKMLGIIPQQKLPVDRRAENKQRNQNQSQSVNAQRSHT